MEGGLGFWLLMVAEVSLALQVTYVFCFAGPAGD